MAARGDERLAGVKTDVRAARHQRVVGEPRILLRVLHLEQVRLQNRIGAERLLTRGFGFLFTNARLEPLPLAVDERHDRRGRAADEGRKLGDVIERLLRRGVEDVILPQGLQPGGFVVRQRRCHRAKIKPPPPKCNGQTSALSWIF